jgi:hypothetical protein
LEYFSIQLSPHLHLQKKTLSAPVRESREIVFAIEDFVVIFSITIEEYNGEPQDGQSNLSS